MMGLDQTVFSNCAPRWLWPQAFELLTLGFESQLFKPLKQSENLLNTYYVSGIVLAKRG